MKLTTLFTTIPTPTLLLLPTISLAAPGSSSDYTTTRLLITGSSHNGTPLNGAGTIEEILAQVTAENPHFQIPDTSSIAERTVEFRNDANQGNLNRIPVKGQDWRPAKSIAISTGIEYLNSLKAICWVQPHSCTRISCSYNSAIYLCNDTPSVLGPKCTYIADYAQGISDRCLDTTKPAWWWNTGGQVFDKHGYNVIVRQDNC